MNSVWYRHKSSWVKKDITTTCPQLTELRQFFGVLIVFVSKRHTMTEAARRETRGVTTANMPSGAKRVAAENVRYNRCEELPQQNEGPPDL
ncbi:MAG: hypothetical protein IT367_05715 [Candidatus Hydrogenedentes bacterium]|nr:hypothetical protein [Candidatus Hydrogenedentota bacterium]